MVKRDRPVGEVPGCASGQPSQRETSASRSSLPGLDQLHDADRRHQLADRGDADGVVDGDEAAAICGSAMPSAKLAISPLRSKATPTSRVRPGGSRGTVAQAASRSARKSEPAAHSGEPNRDRPAMTSRGRSPRRAARSRRRSHDRRGRPDAQSEQAQPDEQPGGERGGGDVEFGPHQDRRLAGEHVADDAADAGGHHAHRERRNRRDAEGERLGRAVGRVGGEAGGVEPQQCLPGESGGGWSARRSARRRCRSARSHWRGPRTPGRRSAGRAGCRRRRR